MTIREIYSDLAFEQSRLYIQAGTELEKMFHSKRIIDLAQELESMLHTFPDTDFMEA